MEQGWDPEVKKFFVKVLNSIAMGLLWMMLMVLTGLYFGLAFADGKPVIYTIFFYVFLVTTLLLLIRYYYRLWKKR
jgi:hypothetical protein